MAPDDDAADLRARVRELEQTLADHQATIEQLRDRGVGRRAILAGGAGLVGGAALTGQASAQSAAGQVGTSSEPVDVAAASVSADSVDAGSVNAGAAAIGGYSPYTVARSSPDLQTDTSVTYNGLTGSEYLIRYTGRLSDGGNLDVRFNGDQDQNYTFYDETGTPQTDDHIQLINGGASAYYSGEIKIRVNSPGGVGVSFTISSAWTPDRLNGFSTAGFYDNLEGLSSVKFFSDDSTDFKWDTPELLVRE